MSNTQLATVDFNGRALTVITSQSGERLVAMRPICEGIGLGWQSQYNRIQRDEVLSTCVVIMNMQMPGDDQRREITCLPLAYLNGWLFGIDVARCREEIRPALIQYKRECYAALAAYWHQGEAVNPRKARKPKALPDGLTLDQQTAIKQLVKARVESVPKDKQAKAAITCWSALKSKFGCTYKKIDPEQFAEAASLVARIELEGEFLGKEPESLRKPTFADIIGRPVTAPDRWLVYVDRQGREVHKLIPYDANIMTHKQLIKAMMIDIPVSSEEMFEFAMAALANLKARDAYQSSRIKKARAAGLKI
ncbi:hypothetical protein FHR87_002144 [Azomonas macrocytogenes]|uniref:Antirepressor protein ant N-terminal domain-containing protein n=2 Tax=Azomonas macrocytogenes TaxID=69962 RepID=A0A839T2H2_AZOMA|nr:hypothetical protein [Azomonas macrocytogenes]